MESTTTSRTILIIVQRDGCEAGSAGQAKSQLGEPAYLAQTVVIIKKIFKHF